MENNMQKSAPQNIQRQNAAKLQQYEWTQCDQALVKSHWKITYQTKNKGRLTRTEFKILKTESYHL